MFEQSGDWGMFFIGLFLGYFLMYWIRRNKVGGKGLAAVLGVVVGVTAWGSSFVSGSLDEYGLGLFIGLVLNLALRVVGEKFEIPIEVTRFPLRPSQIASACFTCYATCPFFISSVSPRYPQHLHHQGHTSFGRHRPQRTQV